MHYGSFWARWWYLFLSLLLHGLTQCHQCHREHQLVQPVLQLDQPGHCRRSPTMQEKMPAVAVEDGHDDIHAVPVFVALAVSGSKVQV